MVADLSDNNPKSNGGAEKKERTAGQFFHIGEQGEQGDASARVGAELHPLDYWVLDTGAAWTMTLRKELLDDVRVALINEVCSASGNALKMAGAGRAAFKGADGKPVVLHEVLLVSDLKANLISLRKLAKAGVSTSTDGARTYKGQLGNRVLWDLHESNDVYRSMWQLPALAWHGGGQAGEGSASQGECNAVGGVGVKVSARSGETDWATAHRRLGHVAMPLLKQLQKNGAVKGLKLNGQPPDDNFEICLLSKFTRFPFHSVTGRSKKPLELVHMDLVGPLPVQGHKGERYFLTIEDDWSRLMWAYPLKQKDHAASTIKEDWLPFVEKQAECVGKRIRTDRGVREGVEAAADGGDGEKVQEAPAGVGGGVEASHSTSGAAGPEDEQQQGKAKAPTLPQRRKPKQQLGNEEALLILPHGYDPDEEDEPAYCFLAPAPEEPASMEEALAGPDREKWLVSRDAECQSLLENGTWDLVVLPKGKKAVQCKWVLRIKTDDKGQVTIYKSRLVAKGFMQKEKQDFNERFAPTAKPPTLRVLLANAAVSGKFIIQMDISAAFLNGILEEDVYMTQPLGYEDGTGRVCKLKKSIYGLKQAPRCWYQKLAAVLEEMGFRTSSCDESLFLKGEGEKLVLFLVYVDDILLFSISMKEIQKVLQQLMKNFKCKTLGEVKYYLGMHVERDLYHRWLKLHQEKFIKELGEKYGIETESKVAVGCKFTVHDILPFVCTSMHVQMHLGVNGMFVCLFAFEIFA
ncbi:unnamed protein product [Closterium sp. NIES-53]